jgi:hypothetical protein
MHTIIKWYSLQKESVSLFQNLDGILHLGRLDKSRSARRLLSILDFKLFAFNFHSQPISIP